MKKVLVSITSLEGTDWEKQIEDLRKFKISEFALFVSALEKKAREKLYAKLDKIVKQAAIPFVHARSDMAVSEFDYLRRRWQTKKFNLHPRRDFAWNLDYSSLSDWIYIENSGKGNDSLSGEDLVGCAGVCLDTAHFENSRRLYPAVYQKVVTTLERYPVGANHISAITKKHYDKFSQTERYDGHIMTDLAELDYLKNLPSQYFGEYMAIELANDIATQLKAKKYIENIVRE